MTAGTTAVLSKLVALLDMDAEGILAQSLRGFVAEQLAQSQQRISQLSVAHQRFLRKYGMPLEAFLRALGDVFLREVLTKGVVLYEAHDTGME